MLHVFKSKNGKFAFIGVPNSTLSTQSLNAAQAFLDFFAELNDALENELELGVILSPKNGQPSVLSERFDDVRKLFLEKDQQVFDLACASLKMFIEDLRLIKAHAKPEQYSELRRHLIRQRSQDIWDGFRFEARVWASLLKKNINIDNRERPDFEVLHNNNKIFIEATLARVEKRKGTSHMYKVRSAIYKKNSKAYANKNTALFIDLTNIEYHQQATATQDELPALLEIIRMDEEIKFGAIILFRFVRNDFLRRYESRYNRVILKDCSEELNLFLDEQFPSGDRFYPPASVGKSI